MGSQQSEQSDFAPHLLIKDKGPLRCGFYISHHADHSQPSANQLLYHIYINCYDTYIFLVPSVVTFVGIKHTCVQVYPILSVARYNKYMPSTVLSIKDATKTYDRPRG